MPYDILHSERQDWLAAKQEVIEGIQSDSAVRARGDARALPDRRSSDSPRCSSHRSSRSSRLSGCASSTVFAFLSDHGESWGERFAEKEDVQGVYHMHGAALFDEIVQVPLILSAPGALEPAVVASQVRTIDLMPTLLELAGLPAREMDGAVAPASTSTATDPPSSRAPTWERSRSSRSACRRGS